MNLKDDFRVSHNVQKNYTKNYQLDGFDKLSTLSSSKHTHPLYASLKLFFIIDKASKIDFSFIGISKIKFPFSRNHQKHLTIFYFYLISLFFNF